MIQEEVWGALGLNPIKAKTQPQVRSAMAAALVRTSRRAQSFFSQKLQRWSHTTVWWDLDRCPIPDGILRGVACRIMDALEELNYDCVASINAYHRESLSRYVHSKLLDTGIQPRRVRSADENATSAKMLMDMFCWAMANPPPANFLVISNDALLSYGLHELAAQNYNILLARDGRVPRRLRAPAKTIWRWQRLAFGEPPEKSNVKNNPPAQGESVLGGLSRPQAPSSGEIFFVESIPPWKVTRKHGQKLSSPYTEMSTLWDDEISAATDGEQH